MLPKVKREIIDSMIQSMDQEFLSKKVSQIKNENPILFQVLSSIVDRERWTEKERNCYILGAIQFYIMLSAQDECDQMNEDFPL